jgi:hypothetical protein
MVHVHYEMMMIAAELVVGITGPFNLPRHQIVNMPFWARRVSNPETVRAQMPR